MLRAVERTKASARTKRVGLYQLVQTETESRDTVETHTLLDTRLAAIEPVDSKETEVADGTDGQTTHNINIRFYPGLNHTTQIRYGTRIFEVLKVKNPREANEELIFSVIETETNGG